MTKAIFQIGMLAFCVATVYFGLDRSDIFEIMGKSFIIFTAVVCGGILVLLVVSGFVARKHEEERHAAAAAAAAEHGQGKTVPEPAK